jgi:putative membrane protein
MIRTVLLASIASVCLAGAAGAQMGPSPAGGDRSTLDFVAKASQSDAFEREEGRLVQHRTHNPRVRAFASEMVRAHGQTTAGLKAAVARAHMPPPPMPVLSSDQQRMLRDLTNARGPAFDRTYIDQQVQAHEDALQLMDTYAQSGRPGPIREAAKKTAPLVQHHLDMAKMLQAKMAH